MLNECKLDNDQLSLVSMLIWTFRFIAEFSSIPSNLLKSGEYQNVILANFQLIESSDNTKPDKLTMSYLVRVILDEDGLSSFSKLDIHLIKGCITSLLKVIKDGGDLSKLEKLSLTEIKVLLGEVPPVTEVMKDLLSDVNISGKLNLLVIGCCNISVNYLHGMRLSNISTDSLNDGDLALYYDSNLNIEIRLTSYFCILIVMDEANKYSRFTLVKFGVKLFDPIDFNTSVKNIVRELESIKSIL